VNAASNGSVKTLANYFSAGDYISWDMGKGVLRARGGARLIAFPHEFTTGLLSGLEDECGEAWPIVLYRCGEWWGKRQMERIEKDLGGFYEQDMREMSTAQAHASLSEAWALHGWGRVSFDVGDIETGLLHARVEGSQIASAFLASGKDAKGRPVCNLLAGVLAGMFAHMTKVDIAAHELSCVARKDDVCRFVVAQKPKLANVPELVRKKAGIDEIMKSIKGGG